MRVTTSSAHYHRDCDRLTVRTRPVARLVMWSVRRSDVSWRILLLNHVDAPGRIRHDNSHEATRGWSGRTRMSDIRYGFYLRPSYEMCLAQATMHDLLR